MLLNIFKFYLLGLVIAFFVLFGDWCLLAWMACPTSFRQTVKERQGASMMLL